MLVLVSYMGQREHRFEKGDHVIVRTQEDGEMVRKTMVVQKVELDERTANWRYKLADSEDGCTDDKWIRERELKRA